MIVYTNVFNFKKQTCKTLKNKVYIYNVISYFSEVPNNSKCVGRDTYLNVTC